MKIENEKKCDLVSFYELPQEIQEERKDDYQTIEESHFFLYRDYYYDLQDFMRFDDNRPTGFKGWDGHLSETFFSGVLVKMLDDETVLVASYYS